MGLVSLIIPSLNGERTLPEALASVAAQEYEGAVEVLLADNGSTDRTREVFEDFAASNPRFASRVIDASARRGKSYALNTAIAAAKGDRIIFLDDDDAFAPGYIRAMAAALDEHPFVGARWDCTVLNPPDLHPLSTREEEDGKPIPYPPHCRLAAGGTQGFRREVFDVVGPYASDVGPLDDMDFCIRAALAGYPVVKIPEAVLYYRFRSTGEEVYRQHRAYATASVGLRGRYAAEARAFSPYAWVALGRQYLDLVFWRATRLHRKLTRFEEHAFARRLARLDGLREGAIKTGYPPLPLTLRHLSRGIMRRFHRIGVAAH